MPASNSITEAIKRNQALRRGPSMYKNMKRYNKSGSGILFEKRSLTKEEQQKMRAAKRKSIVTELKYYLISIMIVSGLGYVIFKLVV